MENSGATQFLRTYGVLIAIALLCVALGVYKAQSSGKESALRVDNAQAEAAASAQATATDDDPFANRDRKQAIETIAQHQQELDADRKGPKAPSLLLAMGNLYSQKLLDDQEAVRCYELLLMDFPDWEGAAQVYPFLASCYKRLGDKEKENSVYKRMMEKFTPDTNEYQYAKEQLGA